MTPRERALPQTEGRKRAKPGTTGEGDYFRIILRPKDEFATFRFQDVGEKGHIMRLAGKRSSGSWDTHAWLISKTDAHLVGDSLVGDNKDARSVITALGTKPKRIKGDIFEAEDRPNVPERLKPTAAQKNAWQENIKKAQQSKQKSTTKQA